MPRVPQRTHRCRRLERGCPGQVSEEWRRRYLAQRGGQQSSWTCRNEPCPCSRGPHDSPGIVLMSPLNCRCKVRSRAENVPKVAQFLANRVQYVGDVHPDLGADLEESGTRDSINVLGLRSTASAFVIARSTTSSSRSPISSWSIFGSRDSVVAINCFARSIPGERRALREPPLRRRRRPPAT